MTDDLLRHWEANWGRCLPYAHELRGCYPDQWVRFHSLPESKRYPESAEEYAIVLDRHPYDGGADVLLESREERDHTRQRHPSWLSSHPSEL